MGEGVEGDAREVGGKRGRVVSNFNLVIIHEKYQKN